MASSAFIPPQALPPPRSRSRSRSRPRTSKCPQLSATPANPPPATPPERKQLSHWRQFRAHLLASSEASIAPCHHRALPLDSPWQHSLARPEPGAFVIARPQHVWPRAFAHLNGAVLVVTDVSSDGLCGLILNRPTRFSVASHRAVIARLGSAFAENPVYLGGDCSTGSLALLHGFNCQGAEQIAPGVYRGGLNAAAKLVKEGADPASFRVFVAYSKWSWEQWEMEVERGAWDVRAVGGGWPGILHAAENV